MSTQRGNGARRVTVPDLRDMKRRKEKIAALKVPVSASVMFACPWYQEAVEILRKNPHVSVGVHLVLNSEWKGFRWGPVLGRTVVVDWLKRLAASRDGLVADGGICHAPS